MTKIQITKTIKTLMEAIDNDLSLATFQGVIKGLCIAYAITPEQESRIIILLMNYAMGRLKGKLKLRDQIVAILLEGEGGEVNGR